MSYAREHTKHHPILIQKINLSHHIALTIDNPDLFILTSPPRVVFESGQFSSILAMVGAGLGISIVPEMALERRPDCTFVLVDDERASRTIGVAVLKGHFLTGAQRAFLTHLQSQAQARAAGG